MATRIEGADMKLLIDGKEVEGFIGVDYALSDSSGTAMAIVYEVDVEGFARARHRYEYNASVEIPMLVWKKLAAHYTAPPVCSRRQAIREARRWIREGRTLLTIPERWVTVYSAEVVRQNRAKRFQKY